jgi:hypothetical protein
LPPSAGFSPQRYFQIVRLESHSTGKAGHGGAPMMKTFTTLAVAGALAFAATVAPKPAAARDGGAVAAGIIGGIAAGAIIAGAANARPAPPPPPAYGPAYYAPPPPPQGRDCYYDRQRYWDEYAGVWRRGPRQLVCD